MDSELKDYYNKTSAGENNTAALRNSDFPVWDDYKSSVDDLQYFLIGLYTLVSLLGFMGNLLILMALMRKRNQKTTVNFLIGNLAFSDILVVLFCSPFTLTSVLLDQWMFGRVMCHIMPFLQCVTVLVSTLILICLGVDLFEFILFGTLCTSWSRYLFTFLDRKFSAVISSNKFRSGRAHV